MSALLSDAMHSGNSPVKHMAMVGLPAATVGGAVGYYNSEEGGKGAGILAGAGLGGGVGAAAGQLIPSNDSLSVEEWNNLKASLQNDLLEAVQNNTPEGKRFKDLVRKGELRPLRMVQEMFQVNGEHYRTTPGGKTLEDVFKKGKAAYLKRALGAGALGMAGGAALAAFLTSGFGGRLREKHMDDKMYAARDMIAGHAV